MILLQVACDFLSAVFLGGDIIISGRKMNFNQTKIEIEKSLRLLILHNNIVQDVKTLTLEKR